MIDNILKEIEKIDEKYILNSKNRWLNIAKPLKGLGVLEEDITRINAIFKGKIPDIKSALVVMCADHGVLQEGVTQTTKDVTSLVAHNFEMRKTTASIMAKEIGVDVFPVDIGIDCEPYGEDKLTVDRVFNNKIAFGCKNIAIEDAMTKEECLKAIECGINCVKELKSKGYNLIITGEMGIGNTTPSAALAAVMLDKNAKKVTGKGAGLPYNIYQKKIATVKKAVKRFKKQQYANDFYMLSSLGGLEIAGMVGLFLGGAIHKIPVLIDGLISSVSAVISTNMCEDVKGYIFASHVSSEPCARELLDKIGVKPVINGGFYVGEGTGALMYVPMLKMAIKVYENMCTFDEINLARYKEYK